MIVIIDLDLLSDFRIFIDKIVGFTIIIRITVFYRVH